MRGSLFIYLRLELKMLDGLKDGDSPAHKLSKINFTSMLDFVIR